MKLPKQAGLSLIELMVTLTVVAILGTLAAPSLQTMIQNNQVQALTNNLVGNLYLARSEAAKRGFNVTLCASNADQTACDTAATDFGKGWIVFTDFDDNGILTAPATRFDTNGDGLLDASEDILLVANAPKSDLLIKSNATNPRGVTYRPTGQTSPRNFSIIISNSDETKFLSRIYFNMTGRVRSCTITSGTDC